MLEACFSGAKNPEARLLGQFDIDGQAVGELPCARNQRRIGGGDGLEMNIAVKRVLLAQQPRGLDQLLHRVVGRADDPRREEQAFNVIALIKIDCQLRRLRRRKPSAPNVGRHPVHAEGAVVHAIVGQQNFQQRDAAAIGRERMADAGAGDQSHAAPARRVAFWPPLEAQEASYFAASARMVSFCLMSKRMARCSSNVLALSSEAARFSVGVDGVVEFVRDIAAV